MKHIAHVTKRPVLAGLGDRDLTPAEQLLAVLTKGKSLTRN